MRKSTDKVWPRGQAVKTSPFHGGNTGSIPVGVIYADVAQLAEQLICNQQVIGSSPTRGVFLMKIIWLHGQAVKTSPFHGGNTGSIPVGVTRFW